MTASIHDPSSWNPPGMVAVHVWLCGRCSTELAIGNDVHYCEVCGSRYDTESGQYLGGSGPATV